MEHLLNVMRRVAGDQGAMLAPARKGIVQSVDPTRYCARVELQPDGELTGWLPVASQWVGAGWGLVCPPTPGDQVEVQFEGADIEAGTIVGRIYSDADPAPAGAVSGEFWLVHQSGSVLKLLNSGDVVMKAAANLTQTAVDIDQTATGTITATAPTIVLDAANGIQAGNGAAGLLRLITEAFEALFNSHTHHGDGAVPDQQMTAAHLTSTLKGN